MQLVLQFFKEKNSQRQSRRLNSFRTVFKSIHFRQETRELKKKKKITKIRNRETLKI